MQHPQNITEFNEIINNSGDKIVIVSFRAGVQQNQLAPELEELAKEYASTEKVVFAFVRMSDCEGVQEKYKIEGIPDTRFFIKGEDKAKVLGRNIVQIKKYLEKLIEFGEISVPKGEAVEGKVCGKGHQLLKFNEYIPNTNAFRWCDLCGENLHRSQEVYYCCGKPDDECSYNCCAKCVDDAPKPGDEVKVTKVQYIHEEHELRDLLDNSDGKVLVVHYSSFLGPSSGGLLIKLENLANQYAIEGKVVFAFVNVHKMPVEVRIQQKVQVFPDTRLLINSVQKGEVLGFDFEIIKKQFTQLLEFGEIPPIKGELVEGKVCSEGHPLLKITECVEATSKYQFRCYLCSKDFSPCESVYYTCAKPDCTYHVCANCVQDAPNSSKYNLI